MEVLDAETWVVWLNLSISEWVDAVRNTVGSVTREDVARLVRTLAVEIDEAVRIARKRCRRPALPSKHAP